MENPRIPRLIRKPLPKVVKNEVSSLKKMAIISERKPSASHTTENIPTGKTLPKTNTLRRRSKSLTDLRSFPLRTLTTNMKLPKVPEKTILSKSGQKRPASGKTDDGESKPKVSKRIPDWDYKSRFLELQKKYSTVTEKLKELKSKHSYFIKLEEEVEVLRKVEEQEKLQKKTIESLTSSKEHLSKENATVKMLLSQTTDSLQKLQALNESNEKKMHSMQQDLIEKTSKNKELEEEIKGLKETINELKNDNKELDDLRREMHNTIQDLKGNIRVFCRVRPPINAEEHEKQLCSIFFPSDVTMEIKKSRESVSTISGKAMDLRQEFTFDKVFPPEANQAEVFEELAQLVQSALDGYHVCVFAYGQTGSGKTYTMQGSETDYGMIPRTVDLIFNKTKKLIDWTYTITASFLEIYNENVRDLLVPNSTHNYELRYNEGRGVTVTNLKVVSIRSASELKELMQEANRNRAVAATDFNEHSSRSHSVTKINLEGYNNITKTKYNGSINLIDLAGSESARTSSVERLTETKNINKSLATLGNVMLALHNKDAHIPYRNSKLTFLLQSCLGGNSKTLMFVNIAPFEECFGESVNSLRFASKVKEVKTTARKNKTYCVPQLLPNKMS